MTKTLTEQWRDGELEWGLYYVKTKKNAPLFCGEITEMNLEEEITVSQDEKVESVLAPVPSYEEYKRLQEQLNEANEVISIYRCYDDTECGKATKYCKKWGVK